MEINWDTIKKEMYAETVEILSTDKSIKIKEVIELFVELVLFQISEPELDGIPSRVSNSLQKIFVDNSTRIDKNSFFPEIGRVEPFLKKVLYLVDRKKFEVIKEQKKGLSAIINALNLNPNGVDYSWKILNEKQSSNFAEQLIAAYNLRNLESHNCTDWTHAKLFENLQNVLVIYLFAIHKYYQQLKISVNPFDLSHYLNIEIDKIRWLKSKFVHIEGKEEIAEIELYAKEMIEDQEQVTGEQNVREGTIDALRARLKENQMVVLGDVGMGKSTTLLYLHLKDAENAQKNSQSRIPVFLELKYLREDDQIVEKIKSKLTIESYLAEELLKKGRLNIFLDGLNEIEGRLKVSVYKQVKNLLRTYPENFFLITSRPQHYNREFDDAISNQTVPVFVLQKMKDAQINDFLNKNGSNVKKYIQNEIENNERLKRIIQTPLMLTMLIAVVIKLGRIPSEKGKIIRAFMYSLYEREQKQLIDFDKEIFHLLLCYLGYETRDLTGSNAGLDRDEFILPILQQRKEQLGLDVNLVDFLRKSVDLNILIRHDNQFSFSHELYQEYYAAEFLHELSKS